MPCGSVAFVCCSLSRRLLVNLAILLFGRCVVKICISWGKWEKTKTKKKAGALGEEMAKESDNLSLSRMYAPCWTCILESDPTLTLLVTFELFVVIVAVKEQACPQHNVILPLFIVDLDAAVWWTG